MNIYVYTYAYFIYGAGAVTGYGTGGCGHLGSTGGGWGRLERARTARCAAIGMLLIHAYSLIHACSLCTKSTEMESQRSDTEMKGYKAP